MRNRKIRLQLLAGAALFVAPASAFAQTATTGLADIVVTATKRETNLQETPISISVVDAETLQNRHVQSLMDLADGAVRYTRDANRARLADDAMDRLEEAEKGTVTVNP